MLKKDVWWDVYSVVVLRLVFGYLLVLYSYSCLLKCSRIKDRPLGGDRKKTRGKKQKPIPKKVAHSEINSLSIRHPIRYVARTLLLAASHNHKSEGISTENLADCCLTVLTDCPLHLAVYA